jgi:hypothetical protein
MRLILTLLVRDEEDILEANLRYHLGRGVDHILVTDNRSVDGTPDILQRYERMGRVSVRREEGDTYDQWRWVTRMAQSAFTQHGADWVIHADADEFWWPQQGDLKAALQTVPAGFGALRVPRNNFLVTRGQRGPCVGNMLLREGQSRSYLGRPLLPKVCHRGCADAVVQQGNHGLKAAEMSTRLPVYDAHQPIEILHYQLRGWEHFRNKIVLGGAAYARNTELPENVGRGWRLLYDLHQQGKLREYYDQQLVSEEDRREGLLDGRYVTDRRLAHWLALLPADFPEACAATAGDVP